MIGKPAVYGSIMGLALCAAGFAMQGEPMQDKDNSQHDSDPVASLADTSIPAGVFDPGTEDIAPYLPFDMPSYKTLLQSEKKVFPHWHLFNVSWDNQDPEHDFYDRHVVVAHGTYPNKGRQRPLPWPPRRDAEDWKVRDMIYEIRLAQAIGCDGFWMNFFGQDNQTVLAMLEAARHVNSGFKILLAQGCAGYMPRLKERTLSRSGAPADYYSALYEQLGPHPFAYRVGGELVISGFGSMWVAPEEWASVFSRLKQKGIDVCFMPLFMNWKSHYKDYAPIVAGFGDWGSRDADSARGYMEGAKTAHALGKEWIMPVPSQDQRVKAGVYYEARGSETFRNYWEAAIESDSDWAQIITWNDYSEATEIAPSTGTQYAFYDLSAYYIAWFKTGEKPRIVRDVLYYFHRTQFTDTAPTEGNTFRCVGGEPVDIIELVAFLKKPGTIAIEIAGRQYTRKGEYGINVLQVPLQVGTPVFKLIREGQTEIVLQSAFPVLNQPARVHDLLYKGGSSTRRPVPMTDLYKRFYDLDASDPESPAAR
ncbi:MAG: hypothetical protein JW951_05410 [Lentisphaerae bacterium]|nr:hypothetical protein [Lentisphaerota bacterium]